MFGFLNPLNHRFESRLIRSAKARPEFEKMYYHIDEVSVGEIQRQLRCLGEYPYDFTCYEAWLLTNAAVMKLRDLKHNA